MRGFDNLFGYIEHLGLTNKEEAKAKEHIASDLEVSGVSAEDMVKVIDTLRTKIPKDQKASSTKLPPSAPAGNPAPGATSPGQPEQKKGTPPLKTARQPRSDSNRNAALHARPAKEDRVHEVAGLLILLSPNSISMDPVARTHFRRRSLRRRPVLRHGLQRSGRDDARHAGQPIRGKLGQGTLLAAAP